MLVHFRRSASPNSLLPIFYSYSSTTRNVSILNDDILQWAICYLSLSDVGYQRLNMHSLICAVDWHGLLLLKVEIGLQKKANTENSYKEAQWVYRTAFLLNEIHNSVFEAIFVPAVKFNCLSFLFVSVLALTKFRGELSPLHLIFFLVVVIALVAFFIPGLLVMSAVHQLSQKYRKNFEKEGDSVLQEPHIRKTSQSSPLLKSNVGGFYHMEQNAKLTLWDTIAQGIAFMLTTFR